MSNSKSSSKRTQHSYRDRIREVIQDRISLGKPLTHREILRDAGGGSASTVVDVLRHFESQPPATLVGRGASSFPQRIAALEDALTASLAREMVLTAEKDALREALASSRRDVETLLATHQDAQRLLLQGVDDLRQMVKAGLCTTSAVPATVTEAARTDNKDGLLWKARHDQLLERYIALEEKCRRLRAQNHELGGDFE